MSPIETTLRQAFPAVLGDDIASLVRRVPWRTEHESLEPFLVCVGGEPLRIPYRIYFEASALEAAGRLSAREQLILQCFFTRHHDGFVREECARRIVTSAEPWVVPYVVQLLGEYVLEILEVIRNRLEQLEQEPYRAFLTENRRYYERTRARVISYWNCYYRRDYPERAHYPGCVVLRFFDSLVGSSLPNVGCT